MTAKDKKKRALLALRIFYESEGAELCCVLMYDKNIEDV